MDYDSVYPMNSSTSPTTVISAPVLFRDGPTRRRGPASAVVAARFVVVGLLGFVAAGCSTQATPLPSPTRRPIAGARFEQSAALLPDGRVLIVGGYNGEFHTMATAELYDPNTNTFSATGSMAMPRHQPMATTLLLDGRVLVAGGGGTTFELYDENTGTFTSGGNAGGEAKDSVAILLPDGHVYLLPYEHLSSGLQGISGIYDPTSGSFSASGDPSGEAEAQSYVLLKNGLVLAVGGYACLDDWTDGCHREIRFDSACVYNPETGAVASTATMTMGRAGPMAVLLRDGKVLIAGGLRYDLAAAGELYDPATKTFSPTGSMVMSTSGQTATLLPDGRVLFTGGGVREVELYDPATGKFSLGGSMSEPRDGETATVLQDGRVLIAGGGRVDGVFDASAELYDPATDTFTQAGSMAATA